MFLVLQLVASYLFFSGEFSGISASAAHPLECPLKKDMCSSLGGIQTKILSFNDTTGRCTVSEDCYNMTCQLIVVRSGVNVPFSLALSLDPCEIPYPVRLDIDSTLLGPVLSGVFYEFRNISVVLFGVAAVVTIDIFQGYYGIRLAVAVISANSSIEFIPPSKVDMYCSRKGPCDGMASLEPTSTSSLSIETKFNLPTPTVSMVTAEVPTATPCPPMCSRWYCRTSRSPVCSIRNESECTVITCKACYYSETVRTLPSGCKYKCGMGRGKEENWRCERVWSRCIRKKDREIYGIPSADMKRPRLFKCYSPPKLMEGHNWNG